MSPTRPEISSSPSTSVSLWLAVLLAFLLALTPGPKHDGATGHADQLYQISSAVVSLNNRQITGRNDAVSAQPLASPSPAQDLQIGPSRRDFSFASFLAVPLRHHDGPFLRPQSRAPPKAS